MMRKAQLVAVPLSLALIGSGLASAQTKVTSQRPSPKAVSADTTPKQDTTRPYTFRTKGKVTIPDANDLPTVCPPGAADASYCAKPSKSVVCGSGVVSVTFKKAGTTISSTIVELKDDCTYSSKVKFQTNLRTRVGKLTVQTRFQGNSYMRPLSADNQDVIAGKG